VPFLSLAFTPAALVGLNASLKMPQWAFNTHASAASLAYPPAVKPDAKAKADKARRALPCCAVSAARARRGSDGSSGHSCTCLHCPLRPYLLSPSPSLPLSPVLPSLAAAA
jgi:hypothetical protein